MKFRKTLLPAFMLTALVGGCAGTGTSNEDNVSTQEDIKRITLSNNLVASNLVFVLTQLEELRPINTTIQITEPVTSLGDTVLRALREAGYGIQKVEGDLGANYVRYKYEESTTERGPVTRYTMSIGEIEASREYTLQGDEILPDSALEISGAKEIYVQLNDGIFSGTGANYEELVFFNDTVLPEVSEEGTQLADQGNSVPIENLIKKNIYHDRKSNYAVIFEEYDNIASEVLVFGNDSMSLGDKNKQSIVEFAKAMNPETDLISIIGCSHGKTTIKNGNNMLAVGRANRVKEEFIYAGIGYDKVLDEGCWAGQHFDEVMPRRGVVMTLKRKKLSG